MPQSVFLSYSHVDQEIAESVCARLEARGIGCWIAPRDILPGADWGASIIDAIDGARVMVLVFSAASNQSRQVRREVERAVAKAVPIIPFKIQQVPLGKTLEYFLATTHWLDASAPPLSGHVDHLADGVAALLAAPERDTTGAIQAMKAISPPPLLPRASTRGGLPAEKLRGSKAVAIAIGAAVVAGLLYLLASAGGPEIVAVDFPPAVSSGGEATGSIQYKAGRDDVVGARFAAIEGAGFAPFETRAAATAGRKEGRFSFVVHAPAPGHVTLEARLVDSAGRQSRPFRFSFEARKGAGHFQIDTPHFKVRVP